MSNTIGNNRPNSSSMTDWAMTHPVIHHEDGSLTTGGDSTPAPVRHPEDEFFGHLSEKGELYLAAYNLAMTSGNVHPLDGPPPGIDESQGVNISQGLGVGTMAFAVDGQLYVRTQVVYPGAPEEWVHAGPAPTLE
jgi:hypothetical protein